MQKQSGAGWLLVGVGTNLTAMVVTGFVLGYFVDSWLGSKPIFMVILGCLGFVGGVIKAHEMLSRWG